MKYVDIVETYANSAPDKVGPVVVNCSVRKEPDE